VGDRRASSISRPIKQQDQPPANFEGWQRDAEHAENELAGNRKAGEHDKQVIAPLRAMRLRRVGSHACRDREERRIAANGSTRKKMELSARTEKRTIGDWPRSFNACAAGLANSTI